MMDRNYPTSSFGDPLAPPAQTVAWAYDRSSATIKPSSSYGATQLESELLQRQNYTSSHQMPTYTTPPHPTGLSGVFDSGGNTTEASIMNFLSAMESRSLQAGPASASLLSTFRGPSWPASTNSSTTELYLTGTLPSAATFPAPPALSSYQHVGAFPSRSYAAATSSLGLQDPAFSTAANGLLPHHDPLLHLKASQAVLPGGLAFNHIPASSLGSPLPIQSSTYRSAQESAPHLLQPQFSLLPQALSSSSQPASQPYGAPVFSGSIERALQRECSVIKHHQRPSSSHAPPEQLPGSLQGYLGSVSEAEVPFQQQDPSRQTPVPCSPSSAGGADPTVSRGVNGTPQPPKGGSASQAALQQSQAYPSSIPSPGYSSPSAGGAKTKDCSSKLAPHPSEAAAGDGHAHPQGHAGASPESYPSPGQKQNSVIASQQSAQLPSLLSISHSQTYITSHSQSQASYSSADSSLYKTLPSFSGQSGSEATGSQSLVYTQSPGQGQEAHYVAQAQALCLGNLSQSYPSSHSQGTPNMSYPSQSQSPASVAKSQSYAAGQSLVSSYTTSSSSTAAARAQSLSTTNSPQGYVLMQPSSVGKADGGLTLPPPQTQKYLLPAPSPAFSSANHAQALQNNVRSSAQDLKPAYGKLKLEELPLQDLQALQQASLDTSGNNMAAHNNNNVVYVVSKMDDRYNTQSVIRSSSRSDEQLLGLGQSHMAQVKEERMGSHGHGQLVSGAGSRLAPETKAANTETQQQNHQALTPRTLADQNHSQAAQTQFIRLPSAQVLIEPNQMILLQQPLIHPGHNPSKVLSGHMQQQGQGSGPVQVQYLQMDRELISANVNGSHSQQGATVSHQGTVDSKHLLPKDPYAQSTNQQSHDNKHQFTLNSICFPESMLLADERNILSNVDDILAATAAACGVTPQDFVKATSGGADGDELSAMANPADSSKGQFQTVDVRHLSPGFSSSSSQHSIVANADSSHAMALALNGGQMSADGQGRPPPPRPSNGSELHPDDRGGGLENDYHLAGQGYDQSGLQHGAQGKTKGTKAIKREDGLMESQSEGFPKKRARAKGPAKGLDEDDGQPRPAKRGGGAGQAKRQNSRGSDASSPSTSDGVYDGYQHQERIRQKLREVEEKQPEVKVGFMGSFLDFLKSGPKQHFNATPARAASRSRKPSSKQAPCPLPPLTHKLQQPPLPPAPLLPQEGHVGMSQRKRLEEDLQRNLETLPSFSSDEEESVGKNWALQNSISSALSALDEPADRRHRTDTRLPNSVLIPDQAPSMHQALVKAEGQQKDAPKEAEAKAAAATAQEGTKEIPPGQLANQLTSVAIEGLTDEELSDSGGEGMYRERDEFVVRNEDIESLQVTLRAGEEPPAIWKVQKALLQKFVPELRDGRRVFSATNSYLGYFGDAKTMYRRVYVKFLDTVNKREYVRVCNRKPRCKPMHSMRGAQVKCLLGLKPAPPSVPCDPATPKPPAKPRPKQPRPRAEPPPKKRRKWKEEFPASPSESSAEEVAEEFNSQVPLGSRFLNTRTMKDTFKSFVELLTSVALDADVMSALEQENDELLLPHMKRVEGMITDNRKRLVPKLRMGQLFKAALDSFPEISVVTELKKDGETPAFKVRLSGKAYNRKTMKPSKSPSKLPLEYTVDQQKTQWFSLYHSLQHYKYHTYLMCKDEIASLRVQTGDLGQEQTVQLCMQNGAWVEGLFDRFGELLNQVQQACL